MKVIFNYLINIVKGFNFIKIVQPLVILHDFSFILVSLKKIVQLNCLRQIKRHGCGEVKVT